METVNPSDFLRLLASVYECNVQRDSTNDQKDVPIFRVLSLFHNPNLQVPFRLMTLRETAVISGAHETLSKTCQPSCSAAHLLDDEAVLSIAGNSFHPKLISAALGTREENLDWIQGKFSTTVTVLDPVTIRTQFADYLANVRNLIRGFNIKKRITETPYRNIPIDIVISRVAPPTVGPHTLAFAIPYSLSKRVLQQQFQRKRQQRLDSIGPSARALEYLQLQTIIEGWRVAQFMFTTTLMHMFVTHLFPMSARINRAHHLLSQNSILQKCMAFKIILTE